MKKSTATPSNNSQPSALPAHTLYVELATRIATQHLHYRSGDEETAAKSLHTFFGTTRELLTDNPDAGEFESYALVMLNDVLRPYTARWHGWMTQEGDKVDADGKPLLKFRDEWVRRKFREELGELQPQLLEFQAVFKSLAEGKSPEVTADELSKKYRVSRNRDVLGDPIPMKIRPQVVLRGVNEGGRNDAGENMEEKRDINSIAAKIAAAESGAILGRRAALHPGPKLPDGEAENQPLMNAAGLALSGGGIRSATFCLGIVQALYRQRLFNRFDYLSTVSGGGYLGTFLSSFLGVDADRLEAVETAVEDDRGDNLTGEVQRKPATIVNKTAAPQAKKDTPEERLQKAFETQPNASESDAIRQLRNNSRYLLNGGAWGLASIVGTFLTGVGSSLLILMTLPILAAWALMSLNIYNPQHCRCVLHSTLIALAVLWFFLPLFRRFAQGAKWDSFSSKLASLVANCALAMAVLSVVLGVLTYGSSFVAGYDELRTQLWVAKMQFSVSLRGVPFEKLITILSGAVSLLAAYLSRRRDGTPRPLATGIFAITGPLFFVLLFLIFASKIGVGGHPSWEPMWPFLISCVLILWTWTFLNINTFSLHNYYRNRLCECYLAIQGAQQRTWLRRVWDHLFRGVEFSKSTERIDGIGTLQRLPLSALGQNAAAPYHLINSTLNAAASKNPTLRGRDGDFFLFSRFFCGSPLTGYITTPDLEKVDPHMDLGTAMAVSGAAASTNMGWQTMKQFRFLLTLFNVRLGYWLRRPGSRSPLKRLGGPGALYFFRELFGDVQEKTNYINLSDGGHLENLAVYELLRRQCKFIVCVDGGMEPGMECADLMRLQRYAVIDLGIEMHFDPADLTLLPTRLSRAYAILVKIDYDPDHKGQKLGWMLYLKLAVTGTEPRYVLDYRRQNPDFPHQTTGDQIYDEAQFEAYRALGEAAGRSLFRDELIGEKQPEDLAEWFQMLANNLLPDNDEVFHWGRPSDTMAS